MDELEIGQILHLKSETSNWTANVYSDATVQFELSDFGFEMQDLSNFEFVQFQVSPVKTVMLLP
jgi:hypothetical protein